MEVLATISIFMSFIALATAVMLSPETLLMPAFPPPVGLNTNENFQLAASELSDSLTEALRQGKTVFGNFTPNATSVSVTLKSTAQENSLYDFQFTGANLNTSAGSTTKVSSNSVFRIGSVSKLLTVYALLLHNGLDDWEQPVTKYIPELQNYTDRFGDSSQIEHVNWEDVTIGSLASQMSGIGTNYALGDLSTFPFPWTENGFPELSASEITFCGATYSQLPCTREEYFTGFLKRHPVFPTQFTPLYSNAAYHILGYVVEEITGETFETVLKRDIFEQLGMKNSGVRSPAAGLGVVPSGAIAWNAYIGDETPSGGIYSTTNDLSEFGKNILLGTQLSPPITRRWMKPAAHTSSLSFSVGAPWEIYRTLSNVTTGRTVDIYTKSGGIGSYTSLIILIPDYDISLAISTAGPNGIVVNYVAEMVMQAFIPILESAARYEAAKLFAGSYVSETGENSSMSLTVDDGPGLIVESWISKGADLLQTAEAYLGAIGGGQVRSVRLYPTSLKDDKCNSNRSSYRAIFDISTGPGAAPRILAQNINAWEVVDETMYGEIGIDDIVFEFDSDGTVKYIEARVLRSRLAKVKT